MKILVTGAKGFIGQNLIAELKNRGYKDIYEYDLNSSLEDLNSYTKKCEFVFHLAGVNRPLDEKEFLVGNFGFTSTLLSYLKKHNNKAPIMLSSSIQASLDNPYGISKKAGEELLLKYGIEHDVKVLIYRFENVFGKWSRPNYNSVIATFCHNISHNIPITVNDRNTVLKLIYIDDVIEELIRALKGNETVIDGYAVVRPFYEVKLGNIADRLYAFKESRSNLFVPDMSDEFTKKLYATYLSYLPQNDFEYDLKMNIDDRGSFTEFIKTINNGQVSINISKPGIIKGNHWHHTKNEKFLVVSGKGIIRFRKVNTDDVIEYEVSSEKLRVIDIPVGYIHNIENTGETDLVTLMWANEIYDKDKPDTYFEEV